jgi:hypothetical protein
MSAPGCGLGRDRRLALEGHKQVRSRAARAGVRWLPWAMDCLVSLSRSNDRTEVTLPDANPYDRSRLGPFLP